MRPSLRILPLLFSVVLVAVAAGQAQVSSLAKVGAVAGAASHTSLLHRRVVPLAAQTRISAVLGREQRPYHVTAEERSFRVENSRQGISAEFTSSGIALRNGSNRWGMRLSEYGYKGELQRTKAVRPHADANRVEYRRAELTEWYLNGPLGLEQGFTFSRAPRKGDGPLTLALTLSGNLVATLDPGGRSLTLRDRDAAVARYTGLAVTDSSGRELPAWLELAENQLSLCVDDSHAKYPITVDPLVQTAVLTASDGASGDFFGISGDISHDGNTIVLGAPYAEGHKGAAYVFVKSSSAQWSTTSTFTVKLIASDGVGDNLFGSGGGVRISGDGSTIAVADGSESTEAYVFVNPGSGWTAGCTGTPCVLTESAKLAASPSHFLFDPLAISADGSTIAVSGGDDDIFMFIRPAAGWASSSQLNETNVINGADSLSSPSLSADGNVLAGGAAGATINGNSGQGEVEVFFTKDRWTSVAGSAQLTASDGAGGDGLGSTVAMSDDGSTIVSGAPNAGQGAAYVFLRTGSGNQWGTTTEATKLIASDTSDPNLGRSVGMSPDGTTIAAGAFTNSDSAVYIFVEPTSGWASSSPVHESVKLTELGDASFGVPVAITADSNTFLVGRYLANSATGAAYVFTGSAVSPTASLSTTSLTFGNQAVGTTSATQTVMLTNTGTAALHVSAVSASASFTTTTNCVSASPIAAGGNCSEDVAFAPGSVGPSMGPLTFTDDSGGTAGTMQTVNLSGTGVQAGTSTAITSASPNPALVGQAVTLSFSVTPPTGDTLTPTGTVTVTASTGENCTGAAPSGSCSITFTSPVTRTITASYGGDTDFKSSTSASVSEQVVDFSLSVSPSSETIPPGHLASYTLTATSINGFTGTITLACSALPPQLNCAISPGFVSLSSSTGTAGVTIGANPPRNDKGPYTLTFTGRYGTVAAHAATATLTLQ